MSLHLQRIRFSIRTKKEFLAGTNSKVELCFEVQEDHLNTDYEPGRHGVVLDRPMHDDFKPGQIDTYDHEFGEESSGKERGGAPVPGGVQVRDKEHLKDLKFHLEIHGSDKWISDRYKLLGYIRELRPIAGSKDTCEVLDHGWVELATHSGDVAMSSDPKEGEELYDIALNGDFMKS